MPPASSCGHTPACTPASSSDRMKPRAVTCGFRVRRFSPAAVLNSSANQFFSEVILNRENTENRRK